MARPDGPQVAGVVEAEAGFRRDRLGVRERDPVESPVVTRQQQLAAGREYHAQLPASGPGVLAAERMVGMIEITNEPFPGAAEERNIAHDLVLDERAADRAFDAEAVIVADAEPHARLERVRRLPGHDVDRPADRVPPVQRPLRTSQDFDALDVQEDRRTPSPAVPDRRHRGEWLNWGRRRRPCCSCRCRGSSLAPRRCAATS